MRLFSKYTKAERKDFPFIALFLAFPVLQVAVFFFYVNFSSFALAFQDTAGNFTFDTIELVLEGFKNNKDFQNNPLMTMLGHSVVIWISSNILCTLVNVFTCYMLTKHMIGSGFIRAIFAIPGIVGVVVFSSIMKQLYNQDGAVTEMLIKFGMDIESVRRGGLLTSMETAFPTILTQSIIFQIAGGNMIVAGAYMRIPEEIFESAKIEGCGFFRETFQIAVPCAWPTISTMLTFSLCSFFTADLSFYLYSNGTGSYGMNSISFALYKLQVTISETHGSNEILYNYMSALGIIITAMTIPVVLLGRKVLARMNDTVEF